MPSDPPVTTKNSKHPSKFSRIARNIFTGPGSIFFQVWPENSAWSENVGLDEGAEEGEGAKGGPKQPDHAHSGSNGSVGLRDGRQGQLRRVQGSPEDTEPLGHEYIPQSS